MRPWAGVLYGTGSTYPRFLEANVKSLIFTNGASQIYNLRLLSSLPDFNCAPQIFMSTPAYAGDAVFNDK